MRATCRCTIICIFLIVIFFAGCGRKPRSFLCFPSQKILNITKLDLPSVTGVKVQKTDLGIHVSWAPLFSEKTPPTKKRFKKNFVGFDLFRLANNAMFIPKSPINKHPIVTNYFLDKQIQDSDKKAYSVQPVFQFDNQKIRGPSSQIVKVSN